MVTVNYIDDHGSVVATLINASIIPRVGESVDLDSVENKLTVHERTREQKVLKISNKLPNIINVTIYTVW